MNPESKTKIGNILLLTLPVWLPVIYSGVFWLELKLTSHGPLNGMALFALFIAPAIGAIPIFAAKQLPLILKLIFAPVYYFMGVFIAGIIGWGLCMEMHTCH